MTQTPYKLKDTSRLNPFSIDYQECKALKGMAIIGILLHNFCHSLPGACPENEFVFSIENNYLFWDVFFSRDFFIQFFSFCGHLGVPIFIFLSGYGLSVKYESIQINSKTFTVSHYKKLFVPLFLGTVAYCIITYIGNGSWIMSIKNFILQLLMILNLFPHPELTIDPGPFWYFGVTMQLYIIYKLMIHHRPSYYIIGLTILSGIILAMTKNHPNVLMYMKYNCIGWLLPFLMGILLARHPIRHCPFDSKIKWIAAWIVSLMLWILFSLHFQLWLLLPGIIIICAIFFIKTLPNYFIRLLSFVGELSLIIFVIHPILRPVLLPKIYQIGVYPSLILYFVLTLLVSYVIFKIKGRWSLKPGW